MKVEIYDLDNHFRAMFTEVRGITLDLDKELPLICKITEDTDYTKEETQRPRNKVEEMLGEMETTSPVGEPPKEPYQI